MPEAYDKADRVSRNKRFVVALKRYKDVEAENKVYKVTEKEDWLKQQMNKATLKFGATSKKKAPNDYEYVFEDDQIHFATLAKDKVDKDANYMKKKIKISAKKLCIKGY